MRVRACILALALAAGVAFLAAPADAQTPDTIPRRDTVQVPVPAEEEEADTIPASLRPDSAAAAKDSVRPAPSFPAWPRGPAGGFGTGSFELDSAALAFYHGQSLAELVEQIPGVILTRSGSFGRPMGIGAFGAGGGRTRIVLDGFELRGLEATATDLQRIPMVDVESLRVDRTLTETRIEVRTFRLADERPYAGIEGADGDLDSRILRANFTRPLGRRFVIGAALDLVETDGFRGGENFSANQYLARVSYLVRRDVGLQLDYRRGAFDRTRNAQLGAARGGQEASDREDVILRGRGRLGRLWLDGALGRSRYIPAGNDTTFEEISSTQLMGRAAMDVPLGRVSGTARLFRGDSTGFALDGSELSVRADLAPLPWLSGWGEARRLEVGDASGVELEVAGRAGPFGGVSLLGGFATGSRGIAFARDTAVLRNAQAGIGGGGAPLTVLDTVTVFRTTAPTLSGLRAGAEFERWGLRLGGAYLVHDADEVAPFGWEFDRGERPVDGGTATGVEAYFSVPLYFEGLRAYGWYQYWMDTGGRPYLPEQAGWGALEYHDTFFTGNLEPTLRVEMQARGEGLARDPVSGDVAVVTPQYALFHLYLQIRVLDVRAFYRLENLLNRQTGFDVAGTNTSSTRAMYGVRWFFRN